MRDGYIQMRFFRNEIRINYVYIIIASFRLLIGVSIPTIRTN